MHFSAFPHRFDCAKLDNSFECARSIESAVRSRYIRRIDNGKLEVTLVNGHKHYFIDEAGVNGDGVEDTQYSALEVIDSSKYVVIQRQFYEGMDFTLLDLETDTLLNFNGYPVFSPNRRWIAVADGSDQSPVLQIYSIVKKEPMLAFDAHPEEWWPWGVTWDSSTSLSYRAGTLDCEGNESGKCLSYTLRLNGNSWR